MFRGAQARLILLLHSSGRFSSFLLQFSTPVSDASALFLKCKIAFEQIELDESEDVCVLAATLVWSEASFCTFQEALASLESSLDQVIHRFPVESKLLPNSLLTILCILHSVSSISPFFAPDKF